MRWPGHMASKGDMRNANSILVENLNGTGHFGDLGVTQGQY